MCSQTTKLYNELGKVVSKYKPSQNNSHEGQKIGDEPTDFYYLGIKLMFKD